MRATHRLVCLCLFAVGACAQAPAFDAASVRPSREGQVQQSNVPLDPGSTAAEDSSAAAGLFVATHQPLWRYISFAYKLNGTQELSLRFSAFHGAPKSGAPAWVSGGFDSAPEFFDISARTQQGATIADTRAMMRHLLQERFRLSVHFTTADAPVFSLVPAKSGGAPLHLRPHSATDSCREPVAADATFGGLPSICGVVARVASPAPGMHFGGRAVSMDLLATSLPTITGIAVMPRPVVNKTGLPGTYDLSLTWLHDLTPDAGVAVDNSANFRDAMRKDLGLELKPDHAPIRFLVVDHVEKPQEN